MAAARLSRKEARQLNLPLDGEPFETGERKPRRERWPYHTVCKACGEHFTTAASEDRHVGPGHHRFELVIEMARQ